jgi:hypothetical protein
MNKQAIIQHTLNAIEKLPAEKAEEISEFADFLMMKYEAQLLQTGVNTLNEESKSFDFLNQDQDIYSESDLKEKYNG